MKKFLHTYPSMKMKQCSETSAYKISDAEELPRRKHTTLSLLLYKGPVAFRFKIELPKSYYVYILGK